MAERSITQQNKQRIANYLQEEAQHGTRYFKSKRVAEALGLSSKEVGASLAILSHECHALKIEKWSYSNSTTWRVIETS